MLQEPQDTKVALRLNKSLYHFRNNEEIRYMREWLESELQRLYVENSIEAVDLTNHQRQGVCQAIKKLLDMVDESRSRCETLDKCVREHPSTYKNTI
jgi:hypothetical protein